MYVGFKKLNHAARRPEKANSLAAGFALYSPSRAVVPAGKTLLLPLGLAVAVPWGYELQIRPNSSMALKGILVANSPGTVDVGYRGELYVILLNTTNADYPIEQGDRIAQAVVAAVPLCEFLEDTREWHASSGSGSRGV